MADDTAGDTADDTAGDTAGGEVLRRTEGEDDQDLLTYGEAGARITEEIAAERGRLAAWEARAAAGDEVEVDLARSRHRLQQLLDAADRNAHPPIHDDESFERFFGYRGSPRRTTS